MAAKEFLLDYLELKELPRHRVIIPATELIQMLEEYNYSQAVIIAAEIKEECREHHTGHGLRMYGTSWAQICRVLGKYGFVDTIPF